MKPLSIIIGLMLVAAIVAGLIALEPAIADYKRMKAITEHEALKRKTNCADSDVRNCL